MQSTTPTAVAAPLPLAELAQHLATLTDQRKPRGLRYP